MITPGDFFEQLQLHLNKNLPLVAYQIPTKKRTTRALLQRDEKLHKVQDFQEEGFVFAPFDHTKAAVLIPAASSEILETRFEIYESDPGLNNEPSNSYESSEEKKQHENLVQKGIDAIENGNFKKVVLSRKEVLETDNFEPLIIFQRLLENYPSAFVYCWFHPEVGLWLGATPETLLEVERNRFKTMALAGTKRYEGTTDVAWGEKEKEEQQLVTESILESLQHTAGNIKITGPYTIKAGNLVHLRTDITGEIIPCTGAMHRVSTGSLISQIHPTPAICGLPKEPSKKFILENENYDREFYTGFLGVLNMKLEIKRSGNRRNQENQAYTSIVTSSNLFVNLRCMKLEEKKAVLFVGGGITRDSDPEAEWEETKNKAQTMKAVLFDS